MRDDTLAQPVTRPRPSRVLQLTLAVLIGAALGVIGLRYLYPQTGQGPVQNPDAAERPAAPRSAPDAEEAEAIRVFKGNRDGVVNVDTLATGRRRLDLRPETVQIGTAADSCGTTTAAS